MSLGQLLLIFFVTLIVFGPNKLPMLANHIGIIVRRLNEYKIVLVNYYQLLLHEGKAQQVVKEPEKAPEYL